MRASQRGTKGENRSLILRNQQLPAIVRSNPFRIAKILPISLLFFAVLFQLTIKVAIIQKSYDLKIARDLELSLDEQKRQSEYKLAAVKRPSAIYSRAVRSLRMVEVAKVNIRTVRKASS